VECKTCDGHRERARTWAREVEARRAALARAEAMAGEERAFLAQHEASHPYRAP
jgi:hypothetical protein